MKGCTICYFTLLFVLSCSSYLDFRSADADDNILDFLDNQRFKTVLCIIKFYKEYGGTSNIFPGSMISLNLLNVSSRFQTYIVMGLSDYQADYYNSTLLIRHIWKFSWKPFHIMPKTLKYILILNQTDEVAKTLNIWSSIETWNPTALVFVILFQYIEYSEFESEAKLIFEEFLKFGMINVFIVLTEADKYLVEIVTWYPYDGENCAKKITKITRLDQCNHLSIENQLQNNATAFTNNTMIATAEKIPKNLHHCPLSVSANIWEPYVSYNTGQMGGWNGMEVYILLNIVQRLNMTIRFIHNPEPRSKRLLDTHSGIYAQLLRGDAEILIGGLYKDSAVSHIISSTEPYVTDDQTWCVSRAQLSPNWENILEIFTHSLWVAILCIFLFITITIYLFEYDSQTQNRKNIYWALLRALTISIGLVPNFWPSRFAVRIIFFLFIVYGMVINMAFNCYLISTLTRQTFQKQISTVNETIAQQFTYLGGKSVFDLLLQREDRQSKYIRKHFSICNDTNVCLNELHTKPNVAFALSRKHAIYYPQVDHRNIFCFPKKDNVYSFPVSMQTRFRFHLLPKIDNILLRLSECGLIGKWDVVQLYHMDTNTSGTRLYEPKKVKQLSSFAIAGADNSDNPAIVRIIKLEHIVGALYILLFGHIFSILILLLELCVHRKANEFNHAQKDTFWIWCDRIISPEIMHYWNTTVNRGSPAPIISRIRRSYE